MLRSMFAGVAGLRSHQTMMDTVGNNIANINTQGYKSQRVTFQDALYQTERGATAGLGPGEPDGPAGGVNARQVGLGSQVASIDQNFSQGGLQPTGRATDVAIQGEGFFIVDVPGLGEHFTRAGAFSFDDAGNLVTPNGAVVQGYTDDPDFDGPLGGINVDPGDLETLRDISIGGDGMITGRDEAGELEELGRIATATFANADGLERAGESLFQATAASGDPAVGAPNADGRGNLEGGALEMSNVDLAEEFTNLIMAQRGFQANSRTITTSDEMLQELVNIKR